MKKTTKLIEVQTPKGEPLFQLRIVESLLSEGEDTVKSQPSANPSTSKSPVPSGGNGMKPRNGNGKTTTEEMMTEPQKKYLFRIMAMREKTGEAAHDELKNLFKVKTLKEVTKLEASRMIEDLLKEENDGESTKVPGNGGEDGSSF
ncbi:MAG TPA: hypothetical protein VLX91_05740 [Candidatus Acidoferrales bacterium]|nr:hypothetical protein [Candidatus Acidoferrales bacterium]